MPERRSRLFTHTQPYHTERCQKSNWILRANLNGVLYPLSPRTSLRSLSLQLKDQPKVFPSFKGHFLIVGSVTQCSTAPMSTTSTISNMSYVSTTSFKSACKNTGTGHCIASNIIWVASKQSVVNKILRCTKSNQIENINNKQKQQGKTRIIVWLTLQYFPSEHPVVRSHGICSQDLQLRRRSSPSREKKKKKIVLQSNFILIFFSRRNSTFHGICNWGLQVLELPESR